MKGIYWLASYPKSGNTWFRVFLANLRNDSGEAVNINRLKGPAMAGARGLFDEVLGLPISDLTHDEIDGLRRDAYECIAAETAETLFLKVHDAFVTVADRPMFVASGIHGAVYIVRNPLDVAISLAEHIGRSVDESIERMSDTEYSFCGETSRLPGQLRQRLSTWSGHVLSWVDAVEIPVHVMRYEDMKSRPFETFGAAAAFLGLFCEPETVRAALGHSEIEVMRSMEREQGFRERSPHAKSFFSRGTSGGYRMALTAEQIAAVIRVHGPVMRRFGYLDEVGQPTC